MIVTLSAEAVMNEELTITPEPIAFNSFEEAMEAAGEWTAKGFWPAKAPPVEVRFTLKRVP